MGVLDFFRRRSVVERKSTIPKIRGYEGAVSRPYVGSFLASSGSADYELTNNIETLRNGIRALARNTSIVKRYLQVMKDNLIGENGLRLRVRVRRGDGTLDKSLNEIVQQEWEDFCEAPTVDGGIPMVDFQRLMTSCIGRDGEFIFEIVENPKYPSGFKVNPLESDMLDHTLNTVNRDTGNQIRMGVEVDELMMPVAYHFLVSHPGDSMYLTPTINRRHRRVPANRVVHVYERLRPGQTRGEPPLSTIVKTTRMMDGYRSAEVTGRRIMAAMMGFAVPPEGSADEIDALADRESDTQSGFEMDLEPGTVKSLPPGYKFETFNPGGIDSDFDTFEDQMKTDVAMGAGISPVSLGFVTRQLSYSTHRGVVAEDRDTYRNMQRFLVRNAMMPLFRIWLQYTVSFSSETRIAPSRVGPIRRATSFQGRGWKHIDPTKDVKAENEQLAARTTSLSRVAADRGLTVEELLSEIADDERLLSEYGLTQNFGNGNSSETTSGNDDDGTDEA